MVFTKSQAYSKVPDEAFPLPSHRSVRTSTAWCILQSSSLFGSNILVLLVNFAVVVTMWNQVRGVKSYCPEIPYSMTSPGTSSPKEILTNGESFSLPAPSMKHVRYEMTPLDLTSRTPYAGPQTRELDRAWEKLQINEIWRATADELQRSGAFEPGKSLRLEHGGYMAIMRIYHELHCLNWIKREWDPTRPVMTDHLDHCLDGLKQGAMCKADLAIGSFYWWPDDPEAREAVRRPDYKRTCVSWDSLQEFLNKRRMRFVDGVPESPLDEDGNPIIVVPTDGLHTQNKEIGNEDTDAHEGL